jgi:xylitol oxidase
MNKRDFLKTSGAFFTTALLPGFATGEPETSEKPAPPRTNWAGNLTYHTDNLLLPKTVEETQALVKSTPKLRALGAKHSFNAIADSTHAQISLQHLDSMTLDEPTKDKANRTVTVGAGVRYGTLAPWLDQQGFALHNLASLPHITVVGACSTATHGSGVKNGNLSTAVAALQIITADGNLIQLSRDKNPDHFSGAVVGLGGLGVVTKATLNVQPTFQARQVVYENLSMAQLEHNLDAIMGSGYSVSLFTDWQHHNIGEVWIKTKAAPGSQIRIEPEFYGATAAKQKMHPIPGHDATPCTEQLGIPGPWYERLPHFRMNFTPSSGAEIQTEYFVPRAKGYEAIMAVEQLRDRITPHLFITEIRAIAADDLWMSPACQQDSYAIHFTWKPETEEVLKLLPLIEEKLAPFNARPHWAKVFTMPPARLAEVYGNIPKFQALLKQYDPQGKFRNQFLDANIFRA